MKNIEYDIVIIGGGSAGIAAAFALKNSNKSVLLVEKESILGGKATLSEVGTICGLYMNSSKDFDFVESKILKDFITKYFLNSNMEPIRNVKNLVYLPYSVESFKKITEDLEQDCSVFLNTKLLDVQCEFNRIEYLVLESDGEDLFIKPKVVIDCSGNSVVSLLANIDVLVDDNYQAASQVFTLVNHSFLSEFAFILSLQRALKIAIEKELLDRSFAQIYVVPGSFSNKEIKCKMTIPVEINSSHNFDLESLKNMVEISIIKLVEVLNFNFSRFQGIKLGNLARESGIRVGIRSKGRYILTERDVLDCRKFQNVVAKCAWPIEEWTLDGVLLEYLPEDDYYEIPSDCLISDNISNLLFAGKIISSELRAIASARVIGCCLQTGFAAGELALTYLQKH